RIDRYRDSPLALAVRHAPGRYAAADGGSTGSQTHALPPRLGDGAGTLDHAQPAGGSGDGSRKRHLGRAPAEHLRSLPCVVPCFAPSCTASPSPTPNSTMGVRWPLTGNSLTLPISANTSTSRSTTSATVSALPPMSSAPRKAPASSP